MGVQQFSFEEFAAEGQFIIAGRDDNIDTGIF
jgi:hypothetical protein